MRKMGSGNICSFLFSACSHVFPITTNPFFVRKNLSPLTGTKKSAFSDFPLFERKGELEFPTLVADFGVPNGLSLVLRGARFLLLGL